MTRADGYASGMGRTGAPVVGRSFVAVSGQDLFFFAGYAGTDCMTSCSEVHCLTIALRRFGVGAAAGSVAVANGADAGFYSFAMTSCSGGNGQSCRYESDGQSGSK